MRVVFVGEDNPYGGNPFYALYPYPRRASGDNLRRHLGLTDNEYLKIFRHNLCQGKWGMKEARAEAKRLAETGPWDLVVMLGAKVKKAFGLEIPSFSAASMEPLTKTFIALPHPSGLNRDWNKPGANQRAQELLQRYAPEIPWGESLD